MLAGMDPALHIIFGHCLTHRYSTNIWGNSTVLYCTWCLYSASLMSKHFFIDSSRSFVPCNNHSEDGPRSDYERYLLILWKMIGCETGERPKKPFLAKFCPEMLTRVSLSCISPASPREGIHLVAQSAQLWETDSQITTQQYSSSGHLGGRKQRTERFLFWANIAMRSVGLWLRDIGLSLLKYS